MDIHLDHAPRSVPRFRWDDIDFFIPNPFHRKWAHENPLSLRLKLLTSETISLLKLRRDYTLGTYKDKFKLWFTLQKYDTHLCLFIVKDRIKLHYDNGLNVMFGKIFNIYASVGAGRNGSNPSLVVGANHHHQLFTFCNRIKIDHKHDVYWYSRLLVHLHAMEIGAHTVLDIRNKDLIKKDLFFWYKVGLLNVQFKYMQDWGEHSDLANISRMFNRLVSTVLYKPQHNRTYGFQMQIWRKDNKLQQLISLMTHFDLGRHRLLKLKIDDQYRFTFYYQLLLQSQFVLGFGSQIPLTSKHEFKVGCRLECNV